MSDCYRIWVDDGKHNEADDGEDFEAEVAADAVRQWAFDRYSALMHVDPGVVLVRYPDTAVSTNDGRGSVVRWYVRTKVVFDLEHAGVVEDNGDCA